MSFFGDIGDALTGAASFVEGAVSDISHSALGQTALNLGGSLFGDPGLGSQLAAGTGLVDRLFGRGAPAARPAATLYSRSRPAMPFVTTSLLPAPSAHPLTPRFMRVKVRGREYAIPTALYRRLQARARLAPPVLIPPTIPPPPEPPPQVVPRDVMQTLVDNPDLVQKAVDSGAPISIGTHTIDTTRPVTAPFYLAADLAATGLNVVTPDPGPAVDTSASSFSRNL